MMRLRKFILIFATVVVVLFLQSCASVSVIFNPYPSDDSMEATFLTNREDFELLVEMFKEDSNLRSFSLEKGA
jgi:hypothetical protein